MPQKQEERIALFQSDPKGDEQSKGLKKKQRNRRIRNLMFWIAFWSIFNIFTIWLFFPLSIITLAIINLVFSVLLYALNVLYATEMWQTPLSYLDGNPQETTDIMNFWSSRTISLLGPGFGVLTALILFLIHLIVTI